MLYGAKCCPTKRQNVQQLNVVEMHGFVVTQEEIVFRMMAYARD
jgi:hypothetical protein